MATSLLNRVLDAVPARPVRVPNTFLGFTKEELASVFTNPDELQYVYRGLDRLEGMLCSICEGVGHFPNVCATKKNLDKAMKMNGLGKVWAEVKSKRIMAKHKIKRRAWSELNKEKTS